MTIADIPPVVTYTGNGVTTVFPYAFWVQRPEDMLVYRQLISTGALTPLVAGADYNATGISEVGPGGGNVTTIGTPISALNRIIISRSVDLTQDLDIANQDGFLPDTLEHQLDRIVMMLQEAANTGNDRALTIPLGGTKVAVPNHIYITDVNGDMVDGGVPDTASAALAAASAAAASASQSAATASQSAAASSASAAAASATASAASAVTAIKVAATGRLTLQNGVPVTVADQLAASTLFYCPYVGNTIGLYSGSAWNLITYAQRSVTLAGLTAGLPYDVFGFENAPGVLDLELTAWTNATTRATGLTRQDGVLCKTGALTRRYLGTICIAATGQCEDSQAKRYVWNMNNRVVRSMKALEATASWAYSSAVIRQIRASAANQLDFVRGLDEDSVRATLRAEASNSIGAAGIIMYNAIGLDSTTLKADDSNLSRQSMETADATRSNICAFDGLPGIGRHILVGQESASASGVTTWIGSNTTGLVGDMLG